MPVMLMPQVLPNFSRTPLAISAEVSFETAPRVYAGYLWKAPQRGYFHVVTVGDDAA